MSFRNYITEANERVGKIILNQINGIDKFALASWGAKNYVSSSDGIQFDVRGSKFRGKVIIKLKRDLYNIEFGVIRKMEYTVKHTSKGVFAEQLVNAIDQIVG